MKEEMQDWIVGVVIIFIISFIFYGLNVFFRPYSHFSWLESFGIVMLFITFKSGIDTYNDSDDYIE